MNDISNSNKSSIISRKQNTESNMQCSLQSINDCERSPNRTNLRVNFTEKGEAVKERREKFLTAKYGSHQMSLIRKRLAVEMWLYDELQKLFDPPVRWIAHLSHHQCSLFRIKCFNNKSFDIQFVFCLSDWCYWCRHWWNSRHGFRWQPNKSLESEWWLFDNQIKLHSNFNAKYLKNNRFFSLGFLCLAAVMRLQATPTRHIEIHCGSSW